MGYFESESMKRLTLAVLLLLLAGLFGPSARAAWGGQDCCCPAGMDRCPASRGSCSWTSGCGAVDNASPAPLTVFEVPSTEGCPGPSFVERLEPGFQASAVLQVPSVPDPPPRA